MQKAKSVILSPITQKDNVKKINSIKVSSIIDKYKKRLDIDVVSYFPHIEEISLYECCDTGYCFYYPFEIMADGDFYEQLQKQEWYYGFNKWEHDNVLKKYIFEDSQVLEVGCADGYFLKKAKE
ncbi:hypothetical protein BVX94_00395, partial [bacterium B17]